MTKYNCTICDTPEELESDWAPKLSLCTDCWFDYLKGSERKAIAERIQA